MFALSTTLNGLVDKENLIRKNNSTQKTKPTKMKKFFTLVLTSGLFFTASAQNATSNTNHNVTLTMTDAIEIVFTAGGSGAGLSFTTVEHYSNGVTSSNAATLRVRSNKAYDVTVKAAAANFTSTSATTMPVSGVLAVKKSTDGTFVGLSTADAALTTGTRGDGTFNVDYRATPGFNYNGGSYVANIIYTATQQ